MTPRILSVAGCVIALIAAAACTSDDSIESVRPDGAAVVAAEPDAVLLVGLGLPRDDAGLAQLVDAVSDPVAPSYGKFITAREVGERFGADGATIDEIVGFLDDAGIEASVDPSRALISAPMTVAQASQMFDTEFAVFENGSGSELIEAVREPSVPPGLAGAQEIIGFEEPVVEPTIASLVVVPHSGSTGSIAEPCDDAVAIAAADLEAVMSAYGIDRLHESGLTGEGRSAALITVSTFDQEAIDDYTACFGLDTVEPGLQLVESGQPHPPTGEAAMDIELLSAIAPDLDRIDVFQTTAHGLAAPVFAIAAALDPENTGGGPPDVLSASLGWCEGEIRAHVLDLLDHYLLVAAAVGTTVVSAAGNHGAAGCYPASTSSAPHFPASSPRVLAIGGTSIDIMGGDIAETVWNDGSEWAGGGGVSARYDRPSWQDSLVDADGRAYPDIALLADSSTGYAVSYCPSPDECGWAALGGTSAATPIAAGALALVNQAREESGLPRLGLVTPLIYVEAARGGDNPIVARDITIGDNRLFELDCCEAHVGLDQASGWGAPDFAALAALGD
jgi:kumamolisin